MRKVFIAIFVTVFFCGCESSTTQLLRQAEYLYTQGNTTQFETIVTVLLKNTESSRDAALTLGRIGNKRATEYLTEVIRTDGTAAREAIIAVGMLQDTRAVPDLIQVVKSNKKTAPEAVRVLGNLKDSRAVPVLKTVVEENRSYSLLAITALGEIGDKEAVDLLVSKLQEPPQGLSEKMNLRIIQKEPGKEHYLTFDVPSNFPPKIEILDRVMNSEGYTLFRYRLRDTEFDSLNLTAEFSVDNGRNWHLASTAGKLNGISEQEYQGSIIWFINQDIKLQEFRPDPSVGLLFKITPADKMLGVPAFWQISVDTTIISLRPIIGEESGNVLQRIYYPNPIRAALDSFVYEYTIDNGRTWKPAAIRKAPVSSATQDSIYIIWTSDTDVPNQDIDVVQFRVSENKNNTYGKIAATNYFHLDNNTIPHISFLDFNEDEGGIFHIGYEINDIEDDTVSLNIQYSIDQGKSWQLATISGDLSHIKPDQYKGEIRWFAGFDVVDFRDKPIRLRMRASDRDPGQFTDSQDFYLKNTNYSKITQGNTSGAFEVSYTTAKEDSIKPILQYSLDREKTWQNASIKSVAVKELENKKQVTVTWDASKDIAGYMKDIEAVGLALNKIQDPSIVPQLIMLTHQKDSPFREQRVQADEASRVLNKKPKWVIDGLVQSLVYPDAVIHKEAYTRLKSIDDPVVKTALADYSYYWNELPRVSREDISRREEIVEQLYQDNLRKPRAVSPQDVMNDMRRWWGFTSAQSDRFYKDFESLRQQQQLLEDYRAKRITDTEYLNRLEKIAEETRKRYEQERLEQEKQAVIKK